MCGGAAGRVTPGAGGGAGEVGGVRGGGPGLPRFCGKAVRGHIRK